MSQIPATLYEKILADAQARGPGAAPRVSASVIPWRRGASGEIEVYWVRRSPTMRFMGGWHAFPGGGLARDDAEVRVEGPPRGLPEGGTTEPLPGLDDEGRRSLTPDLVPGLAACVIRELFEETGILLAEAAGDMDPDSRLLARQDLLEKKAVFSEVVAREGWRLTAEDLVFAGRWLTPPLAPLRFDNRFFLLEWPARRRQQPVLMGGEHDLGEWIAPADGLGRWRSAEVMASPPILHALTVLAEDGPEKGVARLQDPSEANLGPMRRIEFRPGVILLPLETPTLPPASRTNAFLLGLDEVVLVDPATPFPDEIERLSQVVAAALKQGRKLRAIWLTHHHPDHVGAVNAMREAFEVPVLAHPATAERLAPRGIRVDGDLADGDRILLDGSPPFPVRVLHTPGHAPGHLCFYDETYGSLLIGDLIAGIGTIVIDPPDGDMDAYLSSLDRMAELAPKTLFPAHGPVVLDTVKKLHAYRDHRLWREERIVEAWQDGARTAHDMVGRVYPDVPSQVHPVAERQVEAHLIRLRRSGRIE